MDTPGGSTGFGADPHLWYMHCVMPCLFLTTVCNLCSKTGR